MATTTVELFGEEATEEVKQPEPEGKEAKVEGTTEEVKSDETAVSQEKVREDNYYTPEELTLIHPTAIDLERVHPSAKPIVEKTIKEYKSVIANQTKIAQENAELKRASQKPKTIEDYFNDDPETTIQYIDTQIMQKLQEADVYEENGDERAARKSHREALQWESTKSTLTLRKSLATDKMTKREIERNKLLSGFPDFDGKSKLARGYMSSKLFMSDGDIDRMLDLDTNGLAAINLVNHFHKLSQESAVKDTVKDKITKKAPEELGRAGSGSITKSKNEDFNYPDELEKAKKSGNWNKILQFKGAI
jgi:hypothetical protein